MGDSATVIDRIDDPRLRPDRTRTATTSCRPGARSSTSCRARSSGSRTRGGARRVRREPARSGSDLPAGLRRGRAGRAARAGPGADRRRRDEPGGRRRERMDATLRGHEYAKSADRRRVLGHPRPGRPGLPGRDAPRRRAPGRPCRCTSRSRSVRPPRWRRSSSASAPAGSTTSSSSSATRRSDDRRSRGGRPRGDRLRRTRSIGDANGGWRRQDAIIARAPVRGLRPASPRAALPDASRSAWPSAA